MSIWTKNPKTGMVSVEGKRYQARGMSRGHNFQRREIMKKKYDPMFLGVTPEKWVKFFQEVFFSSWVKKPQLETVEECVRIFSSIAGDEKMWERFEVRGKFPVLQKKDSLIVYETTSERKIVYDLNRQEVYTRGLRGSENFLAWLEDFFGPHLKEWDQEFYQEEKEELEAFSGQPTFQELLRQAASKQ